MVVVEEPSTILGRTQSVHTPWQVLVGPSQAGAVVAVVVVAVRAEGEDGVEEVAEAVEWRMATIQVYSIDATRQIRMEETILQTNPPSQPILKHLVTAMFSITTMTI